MKLRDLVLLLPNFELEGFPRSLPASESQDLLGGWVALWHPRLLAAAGAPPRWQHASQLPGELQDILFVLPVISRDKLDGSAEQLINSSGGRLLRPGSCRWRDFQQQLLSTAYQAGFISCGQPGLEADAAPAPASSVVVPETPLVESLLPDFAALGYAFLQIQLMTRQLRYTSNLDLLAFGEQLMAAAQATLTGDQAGAERQLQACFDTLGQERDHYYSLDVHLLDVTLLASSTLGKSLTAQLGQAGTTASPPTAFLASGHLLRILRNEHADRHQQLQNALADRRACLVGGLDTERPHPLMSREAIARDFGRGRASYIESGFEPPRVFARNSYGLTPDSVMMLRRWGFEGCLLIAWSGGSYPQGAQAKISWEAPDGTFLSAISTDVLDAANPTSYLALGWTIGEALDHHHVPTIVFAHWPNQSCEFAELLTIVARRTPALGKWQLADDYFSNTDQPYHQERLAAAGFRHNWLVTAASAASADIALGKPPNNSPSALIQAAQLNYRWACRCRSLQNLLNLAWQLERFHQIGSSSESADLPAALTLTDAQSGAGESANDDTAANRIDTVPKEIVYHALDLKAWSPELAELTDRIDGLLEAPADAMAAERELTETADRIRRHVLEQLSTQLLKSSNKKMSNSDVQSALHVGRLLLNPRSAPTRVSTHTMPEQHLTPGESWHFAEGRVGQGRVTCVDIPSMGFVVAAVHSETRSATSKERPLADAGGMLSNEFLEAQIDTSRGHLRSLHVPAKRGNRLSLMIARRDQVPSDSKRPPSTASGRGTYSDMVASDVRMLTSSNICGVIRASGHLEFDGRQVAKFELDYEVWRGSRIIDVNIRLSDLAPLAADNPWHSAYILRLAWPTEAAILRTYAGGGRQAWAGGRAVSSSLIEIDEVDYRTFYLPAGLAFHRRTEERFLETVLAVQGDKQVSHRIGIAVDLPYPALAAEQFVDTPYELPLERTSSIQSSSGWLVSADTRSVTIDLETPLVDAQGKLVGMRLFITELEGKSTSAKIRLLRELASAARVDYLGGKIGKLTTDGDRLVIALRAHEQVNVDVIWK